MWHLTSTPRPPTTHLPQPTCVLTRCRLSEVPFDMVPRLMARLHTLGSPVVVWRNGVVYACAHGNAFCARAVDSNVVEVRCVLPHRGVCVRCIQLQACVGCN